MFKLRYYQTLMTLLLYGSYMSEVSLEVTNNSLVLCNQSANFTFTNGNGGIAITKSKGNRSSLCQNNLLSTQVSILLDDDGNYAFQASIVHDSIYLAFQYMFEYHSTRV